MLSEFFRVAGGFFRGRTRWTAWGLVAVIVVLCLLQLGVQLLLNLWNRYFFDALERRDAAAFVRQIWIFVGLAFASLGCAGFLIFAKMVMQLAWRRWLAARLVDQWLHEGRHYQLLFMEGEHDNPDQRIAEDVRMTTEAAVDFFSGLFSASLMLVSFVGVLWVLSGELQVELFGRTVTIHGYMVWAAVVYAVLGSALTYVVGKPLVPLTAAKQNAEAEYRFGLTRARENSEGVAFMRGEADERRIIAALFDRLRARWRQIMYRQRKVAWMTGGYAVLATAFPVIVAAPQYFTGAIALGGLMQIATAFVQVQTALSWFVDNFTRLADWRASVVRVNGLVESLDDLAEDLADDDAESTIVVERGDGDSLVVHNLDIAHPDGTIVVQGVGLEIKPGERVLIKGESGTGKSTLFRAIAGLWPWGRGTITVPRDAEMMFLPQRPYLPLGTLAQAVAYPRGGGDFSREEMAAALERCGLEHLVGRLDDEERWDKALSGGEQQRVAFVRVVLQRPPWVFMDEATAALDEDGQVAMLALFENELRGTAVVSIGHRAGLEEHHDRTLELVKGEEGAHLVRKAQQRRAARKAAATAAKETDRLSARLQRKLVVRDLARWIVRPRRRDARQPRAPD